MFIHKDDTHSYKDCDSRVISVHVPYGDTETDPDIEEAVLCYQYSEGDSGTYGDHPDYGGGVAMVELLDIQFIGANGYCPPEVLALAESFKDTASAAWKD